MKKIIFLLLTFTLFNACQKEPINYDDLSECPCPNNIPKQQFKKFDIGQQPYVLINNEKIPYTYQNTGSKYQLLKDSYEFDGSKVKVTEVVVGNGDYTQSMSNYITIAFTGHCLFEIRIVNSHNDEIFHYTDLDANNFYPYPEGQKALNLDGIVQNPIIITSEYSSTLYYRVFTADCDDICSGAVKVNI